MRRIITTTVLAGLLLVGAGLTMAASPNGSGGNMPTYYDAKLLTINFMELSAQAEKALIAHNSGINVIYTSEAMLSGGAPFISVIDAIQGDGFNPLWREVEITFNIAPTQYFSDNEVLAAAQRGDITLHTTDEIYRCSVVGPKKK